MAVIVTREGKGSPLTNNEVDRNFTNLNEAVENTVGADVYAGDLDYLNNSIEGREPSITAGDASQFWSGNKTWKSAEDASVTLTDAAGSDTLPSTGSFKNVLQAVRNVLKNIATKLSGIQDGATANATDASLRDRSTHTGSQDISTITELQSALNQKLNTSGGSLSGGLNFAGVDAPIGGYSSGSTTGITLSNIKSDNTGRAEISLNASGAQGYVAIYGASSLTPKVLQIRNSDGNVSIESYAENSYVSIRGQYSTEVLRVSTSGNDFKRRAYTPSNLPTYASALILDCKDSNVYEVSTLAGNITSFTLTTPVPGQTIQIRFQQDATGGRTVAIPAGAKIDGSINTSPNRVSWLVVTYSSRGSRWEGNWLQVPL